MFISPAYVVQFEKLEDKSEHKFAIDEYFNRRGHFKHIKTNMSEDMM